MSVGGAIGCAGPARRGWAWALATKGPRRVPRGTEGPAQVDGHAWEKGLKETALASREWASTVSWALSRCLRGSGGGVRGPLIHKAADAGMHDGVCKTSPGAAVHP